MFVSSYVAPLLCPSIFSFAFSVDAHVLHTVAVVIIDDEAGL